MHTFMWHDNDKATSERLAAAIFLVQPRIGMNPDRPCPATVNFSSSALNQRIAACATNEYKWACSALIA